MKRLIACVCLLSVLGWMGCGGERPTDAPEERGPAISSSRPAVGLVRQSENNGYLKAGYLTKPIANALTGGLTTVDLTSLSATDLTDALIGSGPNAPSISNVTYVGADVAAGTFAGGTGIIGFESGIVLSSGDISLAVGPNVTDDITQDNDQPGDADLDLLIPDYETNDAAILEFDIECGTLQVISFQFVFASDEYNEWVNTEYNDVFGFFLNGTNIAVLPDGVTPVSINNVNGGNPDECVNDFDDDGDGLIDGDDPDCTTPQDNIVGELNANSQYYINNACEEPDGGTPCGINTEMDGLTVVFTATGLLQPGPNHIKLAIADAGDWSYDSNVFIKAESFVCAPEIDIDIKPTSCPNPLNVGSGGVLPVAVLGTADVDVQNLDPSLLLLEGVVAPLRWSIEDVSTPFEGDLQGDCLDCTTAGPDGFDDLVLHFDKKDVIAVLGDVDDGDVKVLELLGPGAVGHDVVCIIKKSNNKGGKK